MATKNQQPLSILRRKQVQARTGLGCSTIYSWMKKGDFPKPVNLGGGRVGWIESDITNWIESRVTATLEQ